MSATSKVTLISKDKQSSKSCNSVTYFDMEQKNGRKGTVRTKAGQSVSSDKTFSPNHSKPTVCIARSEIGFSKKVATSKKIKKILASGLLAIFYLFYFVLCLGLKYIRRFYTGAKTIFVSANKHILGRSAAAFAVMLVFLGAGVLVYLNLTDVGYKIMSNGVELGTVKEKSDYYLALSGANADIASQYGNQFLSSANITFEKAVLPKDSFSPQDVLTEAAYGTNQNLTMSYMVTIDDIDVISTATLEDAQKILDGFKNQFLTENSVKAHYTNEINIEKKYAPKAMLTDVHSGTLYLNSLIPHQADMSNDVSIAPRTVMLAASSNTEFTQKELPKLEVVTVDQVLTTEAIPYETERVEDPDRYVNTKSVVIQDGVDGEKSIGIEVTKLNGSVVSEVPVDETITKEPVNKVIEVGTKPLPKGIGTGSFRIPVSGYNISSKYGYRHGSFHTGIDLAVRYGTTVKASDEGVVTFSGWKGSYGYLVIVDHQNGYETYYAHNSKLLVKRGEIVEKGETLAKAGSTGNSTGPHCHFEIRKYGSTVNPYSYIFK